MMLREERFGRNLFTRPGAAAASSRISSPVPAVGCKKTLKVLSQFILALHLRGQTKFWHHHSGRAPEINMSPSRSAFTATKPPRIPARIERFDWRTGAQLVQHSASQIMATLPVISTPTGWRHQKTHAQARPKIIPQRTGCSPEINQNKAPSPIL